MAEVAEKAGLGRESLYKALKDGASPRFDTILRVIHALGLKLALVEATEPEVEVGRRRRRGCGLKAGDSA
jgi:DNA-binding phage protein